MHPVRFPLLLTGVSCVLIVGGVLLAPVGATFADVRVDGPFAYGGKPSLTSDRFGNLYAAVEDMSLQWFYVYRSGDHGASWEYMTGITGGPSGYETSSLSIACGEDYDAHVWLFVAYEGREASGARSVEILRIDTWDVTNSDIFVVQSGIYMADSIHPEICTDSPPYIGNFSIYLVYNRIGGIDPAHQVRFLRSDDRAVTWSAPQVLASPAVETRQRPHIAFGGPLGFPGDAYRVFATYEEAHWVDGAWRNDVLVRVSRYFGDSWDPPALLASGNDDQYDARVAPALGGSSAVVVYTQDWQNSGDLDVRYASTLNAGVSWTLDGWLAYSTEIEEAADVDIRWTRRFYCAYWQGMDIRCTWADDESPSTWSPPVVANDLRSVSTTYRRPALASLDDQPEGEDEGVAWTDTRGDHYGVYFDRLGIISAVPEAVTPDGGPLRLDLAAPYPNPGSGNQTVFFPVRTSRAAELSLEIYDARGRQVARTAPTSFDGPGEHTLPWQSGNLAAGVYYARVRTERGPTATACWVKVK